MAASYKYGFWSSVETRAVPIFMAYFSLIYGTYKPFIYHEREAVSKILIFGTTAD